MSTNNPASADIRDHWWWRPGWKPGRSFYTWHITFADQPGIHTLAKAYAPLLSTLPMFDQIPIQWLHLTMQGVGFTDEVDRADVDTIVRAVKHRLAKHRPVHATIGPPRVDTETIHLPVRPVEPLHEVRYAVRAAIGDVWGNGNVPEAADGWRPHVSLAYANTTGPAAPIAGALAEQPAHTAEIEISTVSLIDLNRDNKAYEWSDIATVRLRR